MWQRIFLQTTVCLQLEMLIKSIFSVVSHQIICFCLALFSDASISPRAISSDLSEAVSTNDGGHSSMAASYGDDTRDQCSLGKHFARNHIVPLDGTITCLLCSLG